MWTAGAKPKNLCIRKRGELSSSFCFFLWFLNVDGLLRADFFFTVRDAFSSGFRVEGGFLTWTAGAEPKTFFLDRQMYGRQVWVFPWFLDADVLLKRF